MKYVSSLILAFIVSCLGWSLIVSGPAVLGLVILGVCFSFAYWMSVYLTFGSIHNYVTYLEELQLWANTMIP